MYPSQSSLCFYAYREFDCFAAIACSTASGPGLGGSGSRRVGCNRGANGIDGVISTATGYAYGCSSSTTPLTLLIGDVATLHDISSIALAWGSSPGNVRNYPGTGNATTTTSTTTTNSTNNNSNNLPSVLGGGRIGKIVSVNNSGGAIFSFLPAAKHRGNNDFFTPYLDTPHNLDLHTIAAALMGDDGGVPLASVSVRSELAFVSMRSVRVTTIASLTQALLDPCIFFIECVGLPR